MVKQKKTKRFKPYKYGAGRLEICVKEILLDDVAIDKRSLTDADRNLLKLEGEENWSSAEILCEIKFAGNDLEDFAPNNNLSSIDLVVVGRCSRTFFREKLWSKKASSYDFNDIKLKIHRDKVRGKVFLHPYAVLNDNFEGIDSYLASQASMKVADGREWEVRMDVSNQVGKSNIKLEYKDFSSIEQEDISKSQLYYFDLSVGVNPILQLNSKSPLVKRILDSEGTRGFDARLRDILYDSIILPAHYELLMYAISGYDRGQETFDFEWQKNILTHDIDNMIEDNSSFEQKCEELYDIFQENPYHLFSYINKAVSQRREILENAIKIIEESEG